MENIDSFALDDFEAKSNPLFPQFPPFAGDSLSRVRPSIIY